jgi:hypothetical protein
MSGANFSNYDRKNSEYTPFREKPKTRPRAGDAPSTLFQLSAFGCVPFLDRSTRTAKWPIAECRQPTAESRSQKNGRPF